jgi:hypothetical protein
VDRHQLHRIAVEFTRDRFQIRLGETICYCKNGNAAQEKGCCR